MRSKNPPRSKWKNNYFSMSALVTAASSSKIGYELDRLLAGLVNTPNTNVYDKAIDSVYLSTGCGGSHLHHLIDGNHDVWGAFSAAEKALPLDSFGAEVLGTAGHLSKDLFSVMGLPVVSLSPECFTSWSEWGQHHLGVSKTWQADLMQINGMELFGGALCGVAVLVGMSQGDTRALTEFAASTGLSGLLGANPLVILVAVVALVVAWQLKQKGDSWLPEIRCASIAAFVTGTTICVGSFMAGTTAGGFLSAMTAISLTLLSGFLLQQYLLTHVKDSAFADVVKWVTHFRVNNIGRLQEQALG